MRDSVPNADWKQAFILFESVGWRVQPDIKGYNSLLQCTRRASQCMSSECKFLGAKNHGSLGVEVAIGAGSPASSNQKGCHQHQHGSVGLGGYRPVARCHTHLARCASGGHPAQHCGLWSGIPLCSAVLAA
eukprot:symbB.v1.2.007068.t1/scaffold414.1/size398445/32